ncbi:hypothetical protein M409DRAFT_19220 [Zasmidium cellare ATCC 36951]|uniref:Cytochrome P450 n=1 Tax=Zasmidium cellare ATCC 36951 TaxID=1080233 RepID=A0A6A6CW18_ZASCE|nr:uncharacterized protein M409DRAFT_19220 [Zasmidium cellare ATCC 36951]KAF2170398.1 hypothetical protein M409DRAFT_19220 [Zasmidium cellare ATCC 36951]
MNLLLSLIGLGALAVFLTYRYLIYPIFFSPLSKIPTPNPLCYITDHFSRYLSWREQEFDWLLKYHRQYGPLIRIGPTSVSVNSVEGLRQVYTSLEKHPFYAQFTNYNGMPNMFATVDHQRHSVQKRVLSGIYAKSYLQRSEDIKSISQDVFDQRLTPVLGHLADIQRPVNVFELFQFVAIDFYSAYAFGLDRSTHLTENHGHENRPYHAADSRYIYESKDRRDHSWFPEDECLALCRATAKGIDEKQPAGSTPPIIFEKMYSSLSAQNPPLPHDTILLTCASELRDELIASQEGIAITLTYAMYHLSKSAHLQSRLRAEIASSTDINDLSSLPLLNALIHETLRLHAPGAGRQPRLSPPSGLTLHNHYLPPNTSISSSSYVLHRTSSVYPDPETFNPDRWLDASEEMKRCWWGFGSGGRMCIGNHFAEIIIRRALVEVYGRVETWIVDEKGSEQTKTFLAGPRGRRLVLGVGRAKGQ